MLPLVIKLSGKALAAENELLTLFKALQESRRPFILVHGGGVEVDRLMTDLKRDVKRIDGLRVSPAEDMPLIAGALAGTCSLMLRGLAVKAGLTPLGLVATDLNLSVVRPQDARLGRVAKAAPGTETAARRLLALMEAGLTPVMSSVGINDEGRLWNINADDVALAVALLLKAPLIFLSDVRGVLNADKALIRELTPHAAQKLIAEGIISGGMTVKVNAALAAAAATKAPVAVASVFDENLTHCLLSGKLPGTVFAA